MSSTIPQYILTKLEEIEPGASFSGSLPRVISSSGTLYFVKSGSPRDVEQFEGEAESLKAINNAAPNIAPVLFQSGIDGSGSPYFISEYKDIAGLSSSAANVLAKRLATELHAQEKSFSKRFGFGIPTYCGITKLGNGWFERWDDCYVSLIGDLQTQLESKGGYPDLLKKVSIVKEKVIPRLLGNLQITPVILHGDLWSGNAGVDKATGQPVIFDPASYYGHNEADLSIAHIFGGFPASFYDTYHTYAPKTEPIEEYPLRMDLYQLFHYMNHTLIFGGHYAKSAEGKCDKLLSALLK